MMGKRVLVCGGRDFTDFAAVSETLNAMDPLPSVVIHGAARGADTLAGRWAQQTGVPVQVFPADWQKHGRAAGYIRNRQMLEEGKPDLVIAFPGGRGTAMMVDIATRAGVPVLLK